MCPVPAWLSQLITHLKPRNSKFTGCDTPRCGSAQLIWTRCTYQRIPWVEEVECGQRLESSAYFHWETLFNEAAGTPLLFSVLVLLEIVLLLHEEFPEQEGSQEASQLAPGCADRCGIVKQWYAELRTPLGTKHFKAAWSLRNTNRAFNLESLTLSQGATLHSSMEKRRCKHCTQAQNTNPFGFLVELISFKSEWYFFYYFLWNYYGFIGSCRGSMERCCIHFTHLPQGLHLT